MISFRQFLQTAFQHGPYTTDDVIAAVLPLFRDVQALHDEGLVAPFGPESAIQATARTLRLNPEGALPPQDAADKVDALFNGHNPNFEVIDKVRLPEGQAAQSLRVHTDTDKPLRHAAYIPGFDSYELLLGHHDEQTDIFVLGLVLASLALGLDLHDPETLQTLVAQRERPLLHKNLHPALGTLITEMTELERGNRTPDLREAIHRLENYRDFDPEKQTDLAQVAGWVTHDRSEKQQFILHKLRNRLFDISRRNRLLFYKANSRFANLTFGSVPMVLHHQSIRPELLFTWNADIESKVVAMGDLSLNKYLRFEDHPYLPAVLNKIRLEAQRDVQEFGFSQLKLVVAFLKWHNLAEDPQESIHSPLLLLPVELKKKKQTGGDQYVLTVTDNNAEVNPVLANRLQELFGIELPDSVDLEDMSPEVFCEHIRRQVEGANRGIVLQYLRKPRIRLIYKEARETAEQYRKKTSGAEVPKPKDAPAEPDEVTEKELFEWAEAEANPYRWEFDACQVVLGNFNYKKMSLVRDYNAAIEQRHRHGVFDHLFSDHPRPLAEETELPALPEEWFHVIQADPTQTRAILQARKGESYIIQGPPGTGKSQTITNLIADFVARGKKVLFVCEKRAALDVVFHRLQQQGLSDLCSYIHDSQGDKRAFIKDLKQSYEAALKPDTDLHTITLRRDALLHNLRRQLQLLQEFHDTHADETESAGVPVRTLIERLLSLKPLIPATDAETEEIVPGYLQWLQFGNVVEQLGQALEETGAEPVFASHPLSRVNESVFASPQPIGLLKQLTTDALALLETLQSAREHASRLSELKALVLQATLLLPLASAGLLRLVDPSNPDAQAFEMRFAEVKGLQRSAEEAAAQNTGWRQKLSVEDTVAGLEVARRHEDSFWRFLSGRWRRLNRTLRAQYDFAARAVPPSAVFILEQLQHEYEAAATASRARQSLESDYRISQLEMTWLAVERLRGKLHEPSLQYLLHHPQAAETVRNLAALQEPLLKLETLLAQTLADPAPQPFGELTDLLESIRLNAPALEELLPVLGNYTALPGDFKSALRKLPWSPGELEAGMAGKSLRQLYRSNKAFAQAGAHNVEQAVGTVKHCYGELLQLNAAYIRANIRRQFLENVQRSQKADEAYMDGRRILENEFSKSMRFKSIRELCSRASGRVLLDLKPVWLMSPLSVSDAFPLDQPFFDAVIFDEASQITLEEGVPALYRAPQTIIVGDEKQMPPTDFFSARTGDPDDLGADPVDDDILSADADSLLTQGARKMNSYLLGWHYRSHFETLISYSNHAFYDAALLTIPDRSEHAAQRQPISVAQPSDAMFNIKAIFDRSISYHHIPQGVYAKRGNMAEAGYIAHLVRELLGKRTKDSIGIVAFSQEQQSAINAALDALAEQDPAFDDLLDEAMARTENGQFTGLFVKNLENVQGDERDIIIMSVCYAPDPRGKMSMHFGPINKKGGEKRLNVIFSRARRHMAIVSSIRHGQITNLYNPGANFLSRFLQYAEQVSTGNMKQARLVLDGLTTARPQGRFRSGDTVVLQEIREALEKEGLTVAEQVGQSGFRCSLAVKSKPDDAQYALGIQVDDEAWYQHDNVLEQYYQRPAVMETFGWRTITVYAKDWLSEPEKVVEDIMKRLGKQAQANGNAVVKEDALPEGTVRLLTGEGKQEKFWEITATGPKLFIRHGKSGTKGQIEVKTCINEADAEKEMDKAIAEKKAAGWRELAAN
ncbi:AAA domain-containing protein [Chitinophaga caseinilytica]|uniref:AAA domain-containing protein n=1 Tax=Chitinophaga caseinilytica TaxID=2267521 RepID=A0ABZ2ZEP8_9BACT